MFNHFFGTVTQTSGRVVDASNVVVVCVVTFVVDASVVVDVIFGVDLVVFDVEGTADDTFKIIIDILENSIIQLIRCIELDSKAESNQTLSIFIYVHTNLLFLKHVLLELKLT